MKLTLALLLVIAAAAQQPPTTVIKTEARVVQVDAVVSDKNGNPVRDLTAKDFHLWEDNKEQKLSDVMLEAHSGPGTSPSYTVLFFNNPTLDTGTESRVRDAASKFVAASAGPTSLMAVAEFGTSLALTQNFTADAQRLRQAVSGAKMATSMNDGMTNSTTSNTTGIGLNTFGHDNSGDIANRQGQSNFLEAVASLARNLHEVPGRKTIILFSGGMPLDQANNGALAAAINICNRINVAIYPMETAGLVSPMASSTIDKSKTGKSSIAGGSSPLAVAPDEAASITDLILHALSKGTSGYIIQDTNDMSGAMAKVFREESGYYLLSYVPAESPDGSCHSIRVKVDHAGDLRARSSYCNSKSNDVLAGKPIEHDLENRLAGSQTGSLGASLALPYFYPDAGIALLNVAMEVPSTAIKVDKAKKGFHGEANVLGIAYANGAPAARFSDTLAFDFPNQVELDNFRLHPLHYEKQIRIAPGKYTFKVVFATAADSFSKLEAPLDIDPYDAKAFAVSGLALCKEIRPASEMGSNVDQELMEGRTPLVYHDKRFVPFGGNQFQKSDALAIYLETYDPAASSPPAPALSIALRVLDKKSGAEQFNGTAKVESAEVAGKRAVPYGLRFPLASLAPAWYTAEVKVADSAGKTATRTIDFEVR